MVCKRRPLILSNKCTTVLGAKSREAMWARDRGYMGTLYFLLKLALKIKSINEMAISKTLRKSIKEIRELRGRNGE